MGTRHQRRSTRISGYAIALAVAVAAGLAGCQSYLEDAEARTVGEFTDDATIQLIVKKRLIGAQDVRGMRINVEVNKGVVALIGRVRTEEERERALKIAASVPNVVKVVDQLAVPTQPDE